VVWPNVHATWEPPLGVGRESADGLCIGGWLLGAPTNRFWVALALGDMLGWQPRAVLRTARRIRAAAAWCRARRAGRERAAAELTAQQRPAASAIAAELVGAGLGRIPRDEACRALLTRALGELARSQERLLAAVAAGMPMPRPRVVELVRTPTGDRLIWPAPVPGPAPLGAVCWEWAPLPSGADGGRTVWRMDSVRGREWVASDLAMRLGWQPRPVLRALRRIQAAAAWCRARVESRRQAEAALEALAGLGAGQSGGGI
jgi:hypothetical protein